MSTVAAAAAPASAARRERPAQAPPDCSTAVSLAEAEGAHLLCRTPPNRLANTQGQAGPGERPCEPQVAQARALPTAGGSAVSARCGSASGLVIASDTGGSCIDMHSTRLVSCRLGAVRLMSYATICGEAGMLVSALLTRACSTTINPATNVFDPAHEMSAARGWRLPTLEIVNSRTRSVHSACSSVSTSRLPSQARVTWHYFTLHTHKGERRDGAQGSLHCVGVAMHISALSQPSLALGGPHEPYPSATLASPRRASSARQLPARQTASKAAAQDRLGQPLTPRFSRDWNSAVLAASRSRGKHIDSDRPDGSSCRQLLRRLAPCRSAGSRLRCREVTCLLALAESACQEGAKKTP